MTEAGRLSLVSLQRAARCTSKCPLVFPRRGFQLIPLPVTTLTIADVDTTNFSAQPNFRGSSETLHVVERFQPIDDDTFLYHATIEDPFVFSKS